ncbi:MAG: cyclopropane-fatty-acyl-phospholipid synthase family protein [Alphaproteobacteria bacterium]|nr:cyclopropane-fatty-acyl-phospholipid synthase family protein [Alphaproteobacteria bacterium]
MSDITAERYEKNVEKQAPLTTKNRTPVALSAMSLIRRGQLDLVLPDGQRAVYGGKEPGPSAVMHVRDWKVFKRIFSHGDIGLGEDYIRGLWDTQDLKNLMRVAVENIHEHYDLGNDFYKLWLDESMTYSCALFRGDDSKSLREAQQDKYQRILGKLSPAPGETLLEIGCGWGGFMEEAARSGVPVTGVTISEEQAEFARTRLQKAGLSGLTQVRLQDYREVPERYDHIVSIGMFEHVGEEFWAEYMDTVRKHLRPGGKAMIQTIIVREDLFKSYRKSSDFIRAHIFPGGMLPSRGRFEQEAAKAGLKIKDVFHFGQDYAITLEKWLENFDDRMEDIKALGYCDKFIRKWRFYLTSCAAMFRGGRIDVMQVEVLRDA